jgi:hypothetical protein
VTVQSTTAETNLVDGAKASYEASCPAGQVAIGGGGRGDDFNSELTVVGSSRPSVAGGLVPANGQPFDSWRLTVQNPAGGAEPGIQPTVWVICAALPPAPEAP